MANWNAVVTNGGKNLFASWVAGATLNFDSAAGGTGTVSLTSLTAQTQLASQKQTLSLLGSEAVTDGIKLKIQITAPASGYTLNQIGVWGSIGGGTSTMLAIFQSDEGVTIPSNTQTPDFVYNFFATIAVSNVGDFTLTVDTSALVSQSTLDAALNRKADLGTDDKLLLEQLTDHASEEITYGLGMGSKYGHVKLSDATDFDSGASDGIAATPKAVKAAYDLAVEAKEAAGIDDRFILSITFDADLTGKAFTVTGGSLSYSGNVPSSLQVAIEAPDANTTYTVTCDGYYVSVSVGQYYGIYSAVLLCISYTLAENSWDTIAQIAESGRADNYWAIGDEIDITLTTGETLTLQIYDFAHDDLANGEGKAGITFGMKNLMAEKQRMEASAINTNSFSGCEMYFWLTDTILPSLPVDLQAVIKPVTKKTSAGGQSTTILSETMSIFLFSEVECHGKATHSVAGEGEQYPIFTDDSSRIKYNTYGVATVWWERSPWAASSASFGVVTSAGNASANGAVNSWGVNFGFCI